MQAAFHFNADELGYSYGFPIEVALLRQLAAEPPTQVDVRVMRGDVHPMAEHRSQPRAAETGRPRYWWGAPLLHPCGVWCTVPPEWLVTLVTHRIYAVVLDGLQPEQAVTLGRRLQLQRGFLGSIEIQPHWRLHRTCYLQALLPAFHVVGRKLYFYVDPSFGSRIADNESVIDSSFCEATGYTAALEMAPGFDMTVDELLADRAMQGSEAPS